MDKLGDLQGRDPNAGQDALAGIIKVDGSSGGSGLYLIAVNVRIRVRKTRGQINGCVSKHRTSPLDKRPAEIEFHVNLLRDKLEDVLTQTAGNEPGCIRGYFRCGERWKLLAQNRLEQPQPHVEILDKKSDRILIGDRCLKIESVSGWNSDKGRGIADPDRRNINLYLADGGKVVSDIDARKTMQLVKDGIQLGFDL